MEKLNNISKILRDCPKGIKLYSAVHGECILNGVYNTGIHVKLHDNAKNIYSFNEFGQYGSFNSECLLFPSKENRDWSTFQIPFKDGDVVVSIHNDIHLLRTKDSSYCAFRKRWNNKFDPTITTSIKIARLATEEEKQKLFDAIKANGYKWNAETKTLEKLIIPKFKVGDRVRNKNYKDYIYDIHDIVDKGYRAKEINADYPIIILFGSQEDNYELVPNKFDISTLKPFDKVLTRVTTGDVWGNDFFGYYKDGWFHCSGHIASHYCIPYESNEHLLGTTKDCDEYFKTWK